MANANQPNSETFQLQTSVTKTASFSGAAANARIGGADQDLLGYKDLIVTLDITAAARPGVETYDLYVTTTDGVSSWDVIHFPQIATAGAKRFTAIVSGLVYPQNVTSASPGILAVTSATLQTDTAGANQGIRTLAAGIVRHGPWGNTLGHELVVAGGGAPSITYSITVTAK